MRPVYVASRGRPDSTTLRLLRREGILHIAVVEPHERRDYLAAGASNATLASLPESGQGLAYVRQWILDHAAEHTDWYWMLDDDITALYVAGHGKTIKTTIGTGLLLAERSLEELEPWGQAGLEYQQYAWSKTNGYTVNGYCDVAVAIKTDTPAVFRPEAGLKVDRDFTLQVLASGRRTIRLSSVAFAAPTIGSNQGGLFDEYAAGRERRDSEWMEQEWPDVARVVVKPNGRTDAAINWKAAYAG